MIKNILCSILLLSLIPGVSLAEKTSLKVGYVDIQLALGKSKAGQKAQKSYESDVKSAQNKLDSKKSEYERLRGEYDSQKDSLSSSARAEREEKLIELERNLKRSFKDTQEKLRRKNAKIVNDLVDKMRGVVAKVGKDKGFTIILEKGSQALLYADNSIDITGDVVKEFNKGN